MGSVGKKSSGSNMNLEEDSSFNLSSSQAEYEDKIRSSNVEYGAYFDASGNMLLEGVGNHDEIEFDSFEMNHQVEQRVWNDEKINFTHNHPDNTIFSPEDIEIFDTLENYSIRAVLPNGTSYTLIRNQPRTSTDWELDVNTGELKRTYEGKKMAPDYDKEYSKIYIPAMKQIRATTAWGSPERAKAESELDKRVAKHMETWLKKNAHRYGYIFKM